MPIRFRCQNCGQLLSISRRKAGTEVTCPECIHRTPVPELQDTGEQQDEDSEIRMQTAHSGESDNTSDPDSAWKQHPNPWLQDDEDDEDDFQLASSPLEESGLDMTPMVDVTFLLLIFFMITASFSMQKSLETAPPEPDEDGVSQSVVIEELEEDSVIVAIDEEDQIRVDDVPVSGIRELTDALAAKVSAEGKTEMLIEAHAKATHGTVVAVTDAGIEVHMQRIRRASKDGDD